MERIPLDQLKNGGFYKIQARNFSYGVYREEGKCFIGIRSKFGHLYLDTEFDWEVGPPCGTAFPLKFLEDCPIQPIREFVDNIPNKPLFNWIQEAQVRYDDKD
jgi:hypothetical protein